MSKIDNFLSRLQRVRATGSGRWIASCPTANHANGDKHPSMTISEGSDGRVLACCHSQQCSIDEIAGAVGMSVGELMPENLGYHRMKPQRVPHNPIDVMSAIRTDLTVALVMMKDIKKGMVLDESHSLLMAKLIGRVTMAIELAGAQ